MAVINLQPFHFRNGFVTAASRLMPPHGGFRIETAVVCPFWHSGLHFDPQLASRDNFWLTTAVTSREKGGNPIFVSTNPHGPFSEFKNIGFERSYGHFGPINKCLEALILDTGFR